MNERGNYSPAKKDDDRERYWPIYKDTPAESASRYFFGTAPTNPTGAVLLMLGGLAVIGVGGVVGLGVRAFTKSNAPPATTSQKVVRAGLVGGLVATGAYVYAQK